jgi:hypothetical protein
MLRQCRFSSDTNSGWIIGQLMADALACGLKDKWDADIG